MEGGGGQVNCGSHEDFARNPIPNKHSYSITQSEKIQVTKK